MSDVTFNDTLPHDLLERLFGTDILKRGWQVMVPANENDADGELHPAFIQALLKRRRSW